MSIVSRGFWTILFLAVAMTALYVTLFHSHMHPGWARAAGLFGGLAFLGAALRFAKFGTGDAQERFGKSVMVVCMLMFIGILIVNTVIPDLLKIR